MKRNSLRIVCNPYAERIAYYFKNEYGEWDVLSGNSSLSRHAYTNTTLIDSAEKILTTADEVYNRKNKGLDIYFEGTSENFLLLKKIIKEEFSDRNIKCYSGITKVAVVGKKAVGKTCLIEGLQRLQGCEYQREEYGDYMLYRDDNNHGQWFEIKGIDLGCEHVEKALSVVRNLSEQGLSNVIYCVSALTGRLEDKEIEFIRELVNNFSEIKVMIALTMSYRADGRDVIDEIEKMIDNVKVVETLAKEYSSRNKKIIIEPHGLDKVYKYIFEGR